MVAAVLVTAASIAAMRRGGGRRRGAANLFVPLVEPVNDTLDGCSRRPDGVVRVAVELRVRVASLPIVLGLVLLGRLQAIHSE